MFVRFYLVSELKGRFSRTLATALGLSIGVGLVMGIVGVSQGLAQTQNQILSPLGSIGTNILVTRTIGATSSTNSSSGQNQNSSSNQTAGGGFFGNRSFTGKNSLATINSLNSSDQQALLSETNSVLTNLSQLGPPGTEFTHDFLFPGTLITFPSQAVDVVKSVSGVTNAVGELSLQAEHETGTVPKIVASFTTGGQTITQTVKPPPLTAAQKAAFHACVANAIASSTTGTTVQKGSYKLHFSQCLPPQYQQYEAQVVVPQQTVQQIINPPSTNINDRSYTVAGINPDSPNIGLITKAQVVQGTWFTSKNTQDQVLVDSAYANTENIKIGDTVAINSSSFKVVGIVSPTLAGNVSDLYLDLSTIQKLSSQNARINEILVSVNNSSNVSAVAEAIKQRLPGAQVITAKSLADQVTGSLSVAQQLTSTLGIAIGIIVLLAAFLIAILLTLSNVSKRVREIGTLRAIGWSRLMVIKQLFAETLVIGLIGGIIGIGLGYLISILIANFGPTLTATSTGTSIGSSVVGSIFHQTNTGTISQSFRLLAPISFNTILLGLLVAIIGGIIAGLIAGWRASRLAPAIALRDLG